MADSTDPKPSKLPPLAITAGAIGLALTASLAGFIGWQAAHQAETRVPALTVEAGAVHRTPAGYVVEFEARNGSARTAANVDIEASLAVPGAEPLSSTVSIGYVPGNSQHRGGILLPADPRSGEFKLRVLGYSEP